jgi:pimeloyl-ACP methyl ester carboxylesterase
MPSTTYVSNGHDITLEYDTFGNPADPAVLLIMGFGTQMIAWHEDFCEMIAAGGRYVIRFDNRDSGLSTKFDGVDVDIAMLLGAIAVNNPSLAHGKVPYTLSDMADDACAVLDALGIGAAHVVGASMGGMIAQTMSIEHRDRVLSLTSVFSMTGEIEYGQAQPQAQAVLFSPPSADRASFVSSAVTSWAILAGPRFFDPVATEDRAGRMYDRSYYPSGGQRHLGAIVASGSRADALRDLKLPTMVIHGTADALIDMSGGRRTAELVPGATLLEIGDMGHDLPVALWPLLTSAIVSHSACAAALS